MQVMSSSNTRMDIVVPIGSESKFCYSLHFAMARSICTCFGDFIEDPPTLASSI